jgi:hypothetical protein
MIPAKTRGDSFTNAERRLLLLFYFGNVSDTAEILCQSLPDIYDSNERTVATRLIVKLFGVNETALSDYFLESEGEYV